MLLIARGSTNGQSDTSESQSLENNSEREALMEMARQAVEMVEAE